MPQGLEYGVEPFREWPFQHQPPGDLTEPHRPIQTVHLDFPTEKIVQRRNLAMSGEVRIVRKHTSEILVDLPEIMDNAVVQLSQIEDFMHLRIEHYKRSELTDAQVNDFLVRSVMGKALPLLRLPKVFGEWKRPSYPDFAPRTAWSLFNAYTEVFKGTSLFKLPARTQRLHLLMDRFVGVPKPEPAPTLTLADLRDRAAAASSN